MKFDSMFIYSRINDSLQCLLPSVVMICQIILPLLKIKGKKIYSQVRMYILVEAEKS